MKKKILAVICLLMMLLGLMGCAEEKPERQRPVDFRLEDDTIIFFGNGEITREFTTELYTSLGSPGVEASKLVIEEGIISIEAGAFMIWEFEEVSIADTVNHIGERAFEGTVWFEKQYEENQFVIADGKLLMSKEAEGSLSIPEGVTLIADNAFCQVKGLTAVQIPDGVTHIGSSAFANNKTLSVIEIPESVISIGRGAFAETEWLEIQQEKSPLVIINDILYDGSAAEDTVVIPEGVRVIMDDAFRWGNASYITKVEFADSVVQIGEYAFVNCNLSEDTVLPNSVSEIATNAFPSDWLENYRDEKGLIIINDILIDGKEAIGDVVIPDGIRHISEGAFQGTEITGVSIPASVESIGANAFGYCSLEKVQFSEGLSSIGEQAFVGCSMEELVIPGTVKEIGDLAFYNCRHLTSVVLEEGVLEIGAGAFKNCYLLENVMLPNSLLRIGAEAFYACENLKSIEIPEGITNIEGETFVGCGLTEISLPEGVKVIGTGAFRGCSSLVSVDMPDELLGFGMHTFQACKSLKSITIPKGVCQVYRSFVYCSALESVTFPKSVESISDFSGCTNLSTVYAPKGSYAEEWAEENGYNVEH